VDLWGARSGSPSPRETQKREEGKRNKRKKKKREKTIKGKDQEKGKRREISIFFVYFAFLFTWVDPFGGGTIISCTPWEHDEGLIFFYHFSFLFPERILKAYLSVS
jgi:hypothetical protein